MKLEHTPQPIVTAGGSGFPWSETLRKKFSLTSRFGDPIALYKETGHGKNAMLWIPRGVCPIGAADKRILGAPIVVESSFKARHHDQDKFVNECTELLRDGVSFVAQAPTGFGKTVCGVEVVGRIGRKTIIVVPKEDIIGHWRDALKKVLNLKDSEIGLIQADTCDVKGKKVVIAMVHSICKDGRYPGWVYQEFGFMLIDEVHVMGADTFSDAMWMFPALLRMGLSATPYRKDGKDIVFKAHIGPTLVKAHTMVLKPKVLWKDSGWKLPMVRKYDKVTQITTWEPMQVQAGRATHVFKMLAKNPERNGLIVQLALSAYHKGRSTIIFSELKEFHLDRLHSMLRAQGVPAKDIAFYVGGMKEQEREVAKTKPLILATYKMTAMATDIPWLDTCILGTPRSDVVQIVGRILREYPDKKEPVVFDILDDGCSLFKTYGESRFSWYRSIGARTLQMR